METLGSQLGNLWRCIFETLGVNWWTFGGVLENLGSQLGDLWRCFGDSWESTGGPSEVFWRLLGANWGTFGGVLETLGSQLHDK